VTRASQCALKVVKMVIVLLRRPAHAGQVLVVNLVRLWAVQRVDGVRTVKLSAVVKMEVFVTQLQECAHVHRATKEQSVNKSAWRVPMEQNVMEFVLVASGTIVIMLLESAALACLAFMDRDVIRLVNAIRLEQSSAPTKTEDASAKATGLVGVVTWNVLLDSSTIHASLNPLTTLAASAPMICTDAA